MNVIEYFEQIQIVNMVSRADRRKETAAEFSRHGFNINDEKVSFFPAITPSSPEGFPNKGARGCYLSHLTILEKAANSKLKNILILEDDINFSKHIKSRGESCIKELANMDWDIVYFGHTLENLPPPVQWLPLKTPTQQSHFYAVNGQAIPRLVECLHQFLSRPAGHPDGGPMHYDGALNTFIQQNPDLKVYYASTDLGYQRPSKTDIHHGSFIDQTPILRPLANLLRSIKQAYYRFIR